MGLAELQAGFQAYLICDIRGAAFAKLIVADEKVGVKRRLAIYFDAYRLRIVEALATSYPKLKLLLGDDFFDSTARAYLEEHPSKFRNMRWYGGQMRDYLLSALPQHPIAAQMAAFEWMLLLAFDAEDVPELKIQDLAEIPSENWSELKFKFQPALHLLPLRWNTIALWKAFDVEEVPPTLEQYSSYTTWVIWRQNLNSQFRSMEETESLALHMGIVGASFGEICEELLEVMGDDVSEEDATMLAAQYLAGWLNSGMISELQSS